jgi:hypothetical protein
MTNREMVEVLMFLRPNAEWSINNGVLNWMDQVQIQPTNAELEAGLLIVTYQNNRKKEYPPLTDLADALVHNDMGDPSHLRVYFDSCEAVKAKYPKPQ